MKLLLFSDLHCSVTAAQTLVNKAADVDIVIGAGDFANVRQGLDITIDILQAIDKPAILVPGNSESVEELMAACRNWPSAITLHGNGANIDGIPFFGIGGGIPITPFGSWSYDFTETQAETLLANCPRNAILVSHSPPKGAVDISSSGRSLGSAAIRAAIERTTPRLVVCGHIHASAGQQVQLGDTIVINAGPSGILWDLTSQES